MPDSRDQPAKRTTPDQAHREDRSSGGRWAVVVDGHEAEMTYSRASPTLIIIDHTEVPDALRGRGVGQALVERAVLDARLRGFPDHPPVSLCKGTVRASSGLARRAVDLSDSGRRSGCVTRIAIPVTRYFDSARIPLPYSPRTMPGRPGIRRPGGLELQEITECA